MPVGSKRKKQMTQQEMTFTVNSKEVVTAKEWFDTHSCTSSAPQQAWEWLFSNTGIGTRVRVKCENCRAVADVTDYNSW